MSPSEIAAVIVGAGTTAGVVFKGMDALSKTWSSARLRTVALAEAGRKEISARVEAERAENRARQLQEFNENCEELERIRHEHTDCREQLVKAMAWLAHLENALKNAKISFVPFEDSQRTKSDIVRLQSDKPPRKRKLDGPDT